MIKLSVKDYDTYQRRRFESLMWKKEPMIEICSILKISKKKYKKWRMRMVSNDLTTLKKKNGPKSKVTDSHIRFLKKWFSKP